jgi:hypothetical protein
MAVPVVRQKYWTPQRPHEPVPVSLVHPAGYKPKAKTRHPDAACWYHLTVSEGVNGVYPLVFTRDTAGDWYEEVSELWDLTNGEFEPYGVLTLLRRINECIEQGIGRDEAADTRDAMLELLQELR